MSSPCDPHDICEECPEWIFTLADLLMCMMGLFVILWVLKPDVKDTPQQNVEELIRQQEIIRDIQIAFGAKLDENSEVEIRLEELLKKLDQIKRNGAGETGNSDVKARGADGTDREVTQIRDGDMAGLGGRVTFAAGVDVLSDDDRLALDQIAAKIRGHRNVVLVKGHASADDIPGPASQMRQEQLDLSIRRASAVVEYLVSKGVSPEILRIQGCGTFEPVKLRAYNEADRRNNRRAEIEATDQLVAARADAPAEVSNQ